MVFVYNNISMITDINKYVEDFKGNVYKIINDHYLMLSPCNPNDKYVSELENDDFHIISYNNALYCLFIIIHALLYDIIWKSSFSNSDTYLSLGLHGESIR